MMEQGLRKLQEIAAKMKEEREQGLAPNPPAPTVREFISWFGFQRRSSWLIDRVRNELEAHGLHTEPDFENTYIDSTICFRDSAVSTPPSDGTLRVDALEAAHNSPIAVAPDDDLKKATTIMLCNGFSHVPVMTGTRDVKGIVTWESIGRSADQTGDKARQYMTSPQVIDGRRPLFEAVHIITKHGYVLVRGQDNTITGIITASDLNHQFLQLAEPFLLIGEIEHHVRRVIHGKFTREELLSASETSSGRSIDDIASLTFGEHCRLLENQERWDRLNLQVDRAVVVKQLHDVRKIRNNVMHFSPDGLEPKDIRKLREMTRFFQDLAQRRPAAST